MIRSQRELKRKQQSLAAVERAIARSAPPTEGGEAVRQRPDLEPLLSRRDDLRAQIEAYQELRAQGLSALRIERLADLPEGLIQGRIACGLTQAALAARLGVAPQQVQHWESEGYQHARFTAVLEVATALGIASFIQLTGSQDRPSGGS